MATSAEEYLLQMIERDRAARRRRRTRKPIKLGGIDDVDRIFNGPDSDTSSIIEEQIAAPVRQESVPVLKSGKKHARPASPPKFNSSDENESASPIINGRTDSDYTSYDSSRGVDQSAVLRSKISVHQATQYSGSVLHNGQVDGPLVLEKVPTPTPKTLSGKSAASLQKAAASSGHQSLTKKPESQRLVFHKISSSKKSKSENPTSESEVEVLDSRKPSPAVGNNLSKLCNRKISKTPNVLEDYTQMINSQINEEGTATGSITKSSPDMPTPKGKQQGQIRRRLTFSGTLKSNSLTPTRTKVVSHVQQPQPGSGVHPVFELDVESGASGADEFLIQPIVSPTKSSRWQYLSKASLSDTSLIKRRKSMENSGELRKSGKKRSSQKFLPSASPHSSRTRSVFVENNLEGGDQPITASQTTALRRSSRENTNATTLTPPPDRSSRNQGKSQPRRGLDFSRVQVMQTNGVQGVEKTPHSPVRYILKDSSNSDGTDGHKKFAKKRKSLNLPKCSLVDYSSSDASDEEYTPSKVAKTNSVQTERNKHVMADQKASFLQSYAKDSSSDTSDKEHTPSKVAKKSSVRTERNKRVMADRKASFFQSYAEEDMAKEVTGSFTMEPELSKNKKTQKDSSHSSHKSNAVAVTRDTKAPRSKKKSKKKSTRKSRRTRLYSDSESGADQVPSPATKAVLGQGDGTNTEAGVTHQGHVTQNPKSRTKSKKKSPRKSRRPHSDSEFDANEVLSSAAGAVSPRSDDSFVDDGVVSNTFPRVPLVQVDVASVLQQDRTTPSTITLTQKQPSTRKSVQKNLGKRSGPPPRTPVNKSKTKTKRRGKKHSEIDLERSVLGSWLQSGTPKKSAISDPITNENLLKSTKLQERMALKRNERQEEHEEIMDSQPESHPPLPKVDESAINCSVLRPRVKSHLPNDFGPPASTPRLARRSKRHVSPELADPASNEEADEFDTIDSASDNSVQTLDSYTAPVRTRRGRPRKADTSKSKKSKASTTKRSLRSQAASRTHQEALDESAMTYPPNLTIASVSAAAESDTAAQTKRSADWGLSMHASVRSSRSRQNADVSENDVTDARMSRPRTRKSAAPKTADDSSDKTLVGDDREADNTLVASVADSEENANQARTPPQKSKLTGKRGSKRKEKPMPDAETSTSRGKSKSRSSDTSQIIMDSQSAGASTTPRRRSHSKKAISDDEPGTSRGKSKASTSNRSQTSAESQFAGASTTLTNGAGPKKRAGKKVKPPVAGKGRHARKTPVKGKSQRPKRIPNKLLQSFLEISHVAPPQLIVPVPSPEAVAQGLRRSTRVRCRPLDQYYEKIVYEHNAEGGTRIVGFQSYDDFLPVDLPSNDQPVAQPDISSKSDRTPNKNIQRPKGKKNNERKKKTKKQTGKSKNPRTSRKNKAEQNDAMQLTNRKNESNVTLEGAATDVAGDNPEQMAWYDNISEPGSPAENGSDNAMRNERPSATSLVDASVSTRDTTVRIVSANNTILLVDRSSIFCPADSESFFGPTKQSPKDTDDLKVSKGISADGTTQGTLHLKPLKRKSERTVRSALMCFTVIQGMVQVTVNEASETIRKSGYFRIPLLNKYSLYNPDRNVTAVMSYTMIRKPQTYEIASSTAD